MAEQYRISLLTLPAELLYRICDFLDSETLLLSFRNVCIKLYMIANTYNRYKICLRSISKINICRLIRSENIVSLDFGTRNNAIDWIELFLPMFKTHKFTRLHSLSLHTSNINDLNTILHHVAMNCMLTSFAIYSDISKDSDDTLQLLSLIIAQPTLENIILYSNLTDKNKLSWPAQSTVKKLSMDNCNLQQFCCILQNSPGLHSLIMDSCHVNGIDETILLNSYPQVTSLTLNNMQMTMDKLELLLSLLPSINHLDLASSGRPFEFVRRLSKWEEFIRSKLPRLYQFEFCIFCYCSNWENFDLFIASFRTPFWLEEKRWFVTCQFRDDWTTSFTLFTTPESSTLSHQKEHYFDKITCSNSITSEHDQREINCIENIHFD
ncbi:unnamed protein product [Rotaria sp. Silwood2]|nr:unnamed protein product [Rotaria sp. Silwood2]CAF4429839.1 unnamed protein product [Rotaria sp. Silwood2]